MEVTVTTWIIGLAGLLLMGLLWVFQLVAVVICIKMKGVDLQC